MRTRSIAVLVALALAGCGDIIGLDGYDLDGGSVDAIATDSGGGDAQSDVVQNDVVPDGGCNQVTSVCVPDLPSGWSWDIYDPDTRGACANGYATPTDVEEGIDAGAAACGCGCTTTNPTCTGDVTITAGTNGACNNISNQTDTTNMACNTLTQFSTSGASISVTGPAPDGGSCTATPSQTLPTVGYDHQGRTCAFTGTPGSGCTAGNVCVPNPAPFTMCVSQPGVNACPASFPTQHLVGTAIADTRSCTSCGCTFDAGACVGTATIYTNTGCSTGQTNITANGTCTTVNGNRTWRAFAYAPASTASCAGTAVSADGGVQFSDMTTVCCK